MNELEALLALVLTPKLSSVKAQQLLDFCEGSSSKALSLVKDANIRGAEKELEAANRLNIQLIPFTSIEFPEKLKTLKDCPLILYVKGTLPPKEQPCLAIVGTRAATEWGKTSAHAFAKELASRGVCIVSGLARGIDTAAHIGSLSSGKTLAIIGSGLANIYPQENSSLAEKIAQNGAVVSEFPLFTSPTRYTFPRRNRLISAFSDALLIAEAPVKSGAMITMELGYKEKKPLFALPGRALSETYAGNHHLIKQKKASLVEHPEEIAETLKLTPLTKTIQKPTSKLMDTVEEKILDFISQSEVSINELSCLIPLPISQIQVMLIQLMLKNLIVELPGKRYTIKR